MISQLQAHCLDDVANKLISFYEENIKRKFNTRNLDECVDFIEWLGGKVIFNCILNDRYGVDGAVVNKGDNSFVIFVDEKSLKSNIDVEKSAIGTIYRMLWFHIRTWVTEKNMSDEEKSTNRLIYPKLEGLNADDLLSLPEVKDDSIQKRIRLRKRLTNKY